MIAVTIDQKLLASCLGLNAISSFKSLGLSNSDIFNTLTFLDNANFVEEIIKNPNIKGVILTLEFKGLFFLRDDIELFITEDSRYDFYSLQNKVAELSEEVNSFNTFIDASSIIHSTAFVASKNVLIGKNVIVEPNASILEGVEIGDNCIIRAGAVLGAEGFEFKRTSKGILSVRHDGTVLIGKDVSIGANATVARGFSFKGTIIGDETKVDNLVHVAHGVQIGKRCFLPASCMIAGGVNIEDDVWIGPNASISSQITIGKGAYVTMGSVVTKNVKNYEKVTGNFAVPHMSFLRILKNNLQTIKTNESGIKGDF